MDRHFYHILPFFLKQYNNSSHFRFIHPSPFEYESLEILINIVGYDGP